MNPRAAVLERPGPKILAALTLIFLSAFFAVVAQSQRADAADLCLKSKTQACISSTVRGGDKQEPLAGVDIHVSGPGGFDQTVTTDDAGKWTVVVTEAGSYEISLDTETLPDGLSLESGSTQALTREIKLNTNVAPTWSIRSADYSATTSIVDRLLNGTFSGLRLGLLLALASIGLSLIYGTTGLSNFAHAEQVTMGGMLGYLIINEWGMGLILGGLLVLVICGFTGWFQDFVMWKPLRRRGLGLTQMMIVTIGLSLALQYTFQFFIANDTVKVLVFNPEPRSLGPISYTMPDLAAMAACAVVIAIVGYALLRTRIGRATRAVSDNPALAAASGIDVDRVIRLVWIVATTLAGLSGILYSLIIQHGMRWDSGLQILLLLFAAVTLGGLGTAFGALIGSIIIGLVVELSPVVGAPGDLKYASALLILILLLLVRPQGLLGRPERVG
ncbi:MAG: branched-chain amino acid ABC transporter permease [Nocardioidaceae bacterium]|nr:branched-chain amino acid ABC transporter permease [Nocardioidaceae bacterium]